MTDFDSERRNLLKAGGAALTIGLAGCIGPFQDTEGVPGTVDPSEGDGGDGGGDGGDGGDGEVEEFLSDANNYDEIQDMTGESEVTVEVGAGENSLAFGPAAIQIDPGTTVVWEWTGEGGDHNVVDEDGSFESETTGEEGFTFDQQFDEEGTVLYACTPHRSAGMKGAVVVGSGGGDGGDGGDTGEVDEFLSDANNYDEIQDMTGESEVTVEVGAGENSLAFGPAAIEIDPGTTVVWEWTGEGGDHNVVDEDGSFESETTGEEGFTFDQQFDDAGTVLYACTPHRAAGMKGAVVVSGEGSDGGDGSNGGDGSDGGDGDGSDGGDGDGSDGGDGGTEEVDEFLSDANNYNEIEDLTGESEVTVEVGAGENSLAFGPAAIRVDAGTTVVWEWTGEGGDHNVVDENGSFESETTGEEGFTFDQQFDEAGTILYACTPHRAAGMKGAVVAE